MISLDGQPVPKGPRVFLSSAYRETAPGESKARYFSLRSQLFALGDELGIPLWVHECVKHDDVLEASDQVQKPDWVTAVKECLAELSRSDLVIVVLGHTAGRRVDMDAAGRTAASVLEVELFYASLKRIPVVFYALRGYEPHSELLNLIEVLELRGSRNWFEVDEIDVPSEVRSLLTGFPASASEEWKLRFFHDRLANQRSFLNADQEIYSAKMSFIGRFAPMTVIEYSQARFDMLLHLSEGVGAHNASQLGLLWMALRELSVGGWQPERAGNWQMVCDRWPSAAAWTGMHGTLRTSVLAAFHTRNDLLRRLGRSPQDDPEFPFGPMASELYSMGLMCETSQWKRRRFETAVQLATRHVERNSNNPSAALGIRASAYLRLALLGRPWHVYSALTDYRNSYRIRERNGDSASAMGEALSEWAYAEFQVRHLIHLRSATALSKIRDGVRLMESDPDPHRLGFRIRGKRKLAQALAQSGRHDEADAERREAEELARSSGILGQLKDRGP